MLIRVVYKNERYDFVKPAILGRFLSQGKIKKFLRAEGWVTPEKDQVRGSGGSYSGTDRRQSLQV